jgi:hypothetical protein
MMRLILSTFLGLAALAAGAQTPTSLFNNYLDSLNVYKAQAQNGKTLSAYNQYQLFAPSTFYHGVAGNNLDLNKKDQDTENQEVGAALMSVYLNHPNLIIDSENNLRHAGAVKEDIKQPVKHEVAFVKQVAPLPQEQEEPKVDVVVEKPNFWKFKGDYYLQFLQNYISSNWYKGGESNYAMVASATLEANYDNQSKLKWDNKLEAKLGFQTSRADSIHNLKASEDLLRLTSKLGLQATKKWYYTLNVLAYTQFMRGYKNNDFFTYSDFMSPITLNISIGMNYKVEWFNKHLTGNIQLSPLAYNMKYVDRLALSKRNGIDEGKHVLNDFGSMFTADLEWKFSESISWKSRLYGFSSYHRAELEWENTFTFKFNKYISSNIFIYPRFDDHTTRDGHHGYWQFKEYASLGFNYTFGK